MKSVTFITTGQPATNPRLVKEAETLNSLGYQVKVICCFYHRWAQPFDEKITGKTPGIYIYCGGHPIKQKAVYFKTRLRQKICTMLWRYVKFPGVAENAISRTHTEALAIAKKIKTDIYIAHNLGALPAAVMAAQYSGGKVGYDAEDMHSAQYTSQTDVMYLLNKYVETKYFPAADYFTAASPLIAKHYAAEYPYLKPVIVNNVFPKTQFNMQKGYDGNRPLTLFWFSQTVGPERGLELIIKAMANAPKYVQLHLLGDCSAQNKMNLTALAKETGLTPDQLQFHEPVSPDELLNLTEKFDIGMASETGTTLNRDICLTNKIFTYLQCGLAIIASDTQAQALFIQQYPQSGKLYNKYDELSLAEQINKYASNPDLLYETRMVNYQLGQAELNWEIESSKFLAVVKESVGE